MMRVKPAIRESSRFIIHLPDRVRPIELFLVQTKDYIAGFSNGRQKVGCDWYAVESNP
jgi:hypothetical protein